MDCIRTESSFIFDEMYLSMERTIFVCYQFFMQLRNMYGNKPIFTDGAIYCTMMMLASSGYG